MALVGVELETLVSEPDALTTRPLPSANVNLTQLAKLALLYSEFKNFISVVK